MADFDLFSTAEKFVLNSMDGALSAATSGWGAAIIGTLAVSATLYVTCLGYLTIAGKVQEPLNELVWKLGSLCLVMLFIDGYWLGLTTDAIYGLRGFLAGSNGGMASLDQFITNMLELGDIVYDKADWYEPIYIMPAFYFGVIVCAFVAFLVLLLNTISLLLLVATAPIFIACLSFGFLRGMFNNWLQLIFANIFTLMFMNIIFKVVNGMGVMMMNAEMSNVNIVAISMIVLGLCSAKLAALAVDLGKGLASVSVESAAASVGAQRLTNKASAGASKAGAKGAAAASVSAAKGAATASKGGFNLAKRGLTKLRG